ncbi:DUF6056 family protein [Streptomyces corynorhini]|uniref:Uncharacterized protein n=1 Tax=Streptomyces corynorhini TaxID=2282652 RepID=A0A370BIB5_9ACTN|nr:DUF6056 family protein [Streptomyces corynorhini]RDG40004.1 hypothetical protein DVH02_00735 [Streptomyces corynorhini]
MASGAPSVTIPRQPGDHSRPPTGAAGRGARPWWRHPYGAPALALLPLALLGTAAWLGRAVRPSADEWCFLPTVRDHGVSGLVAKFYLTDNGRLGNGLLVGLYAKFGVAGHQWYGAVSGAVTLALLWAMTVLVLRAAGRAAPRGVPLLVAAMVTAVFLLATPNTYKTFYWPASSVSHTVAPVLACLAALPLLWARTRTGRLAAPVAALVVGCFMGTLSEETAVVVLVVLAALLAVGHRILAPRVRSSARTWCLAGLAGVLAGTALLLTSPGSRNRRERYGAGTASMFAPESLGESLRGFLEILGTLLTTWQYLGAAAAGVLLGLLMRDSAGRAGRTPALLPGRSGFLLLSGACTFLAAGYLCTVITYPLFGASVSSATRTWNDYLVLYVLLLAGGGAVLGRALRRRARHTGAAAGICVVLCAATCAGLAVPLGELGTDMGVRAARWDRQDRWLRDGAALGVRVLPYRPLSIRGMGEPYGRDGHRVWPARCVADYYHLERITYTERMP